MSAEETATVAAVADTLARWRARIPAEYVARADALGPLTREERRGEVARELAEQRQAARRAAWGALLKAWPDDDFTRVRLASLLPEQRPKEIGAWLSDPDAQVLVLSGATGRGKTYAAFAIANERALAGDLVAAVSHKRYLDALTPDGGDEPDWLVRRRAIGAEVLVIDDLGAEMDPTQPVTEFRSRETCDLISGRMRPGKRTIITTNLTADEIKVMFGDRITSRLRKAQAAGIVIHGDDKRARPPAGYPTWS